MSDKVVAFGRVRGEVSFQYGPKTFSSDWGGAFTALTIADWLTEIPKPNLSTVASKAALKDVPRVAEKANYLMWLERLQMCILEMDAVAISGTRTKVLSPNEILRMQVVYFVDTSKAPAQKIAESLERIHLNQWGILLQMTRALNDFDLQLSGRQEKGRPRSISFFFTV